MEYTVLIEKDKATGWYTGQCQQLPEAISQGKTLKELLANMKEAISLTLETQRENVLMQHEGRSFFRRKVAVS